MLDQHRPDQERIWDSWSEVYDSWHAQEDPESPARFLSALAARSNAARILELGIGTGRVASLLAQQCDAAVFGIDISAKMVEQIGEKYPTLGITAVQGDMADPPPWNEFDIVYSVYSSMLNLTDQSSVRRCVASVSAALRPGGYFVVENMYPQPGAIPSAPRLAVRSVTDGAVMLSASKSDFHAQRITMQEILITVDGGIQMFPIEMRYVTPPELDLIAELNGMQLLERTGDFEGTPFTRNSTRFAAVYQKSN
ncbi:class I SAM-dependent methyltransferase [Nocardia sp. NPDC058518]|uniref:class I SAM-dependent methyltransferase n=1 Tax=Nocardia sp. NPDC058518 TaxID=3346534 RepID=UPI00365221C0